MTKHKLLIRKLVDCKLLVAGANNYCLIRFIVNYLAFHDVELRPQKYLCVMLVAVHTQTIWIYEMDQKGHLILAMQANS